MYADIIIKNGRCVTMCGDGGADWVAAAGKMICAAGRGDDWQKLVRPGTQVIDARGGTVLPGFTSLPCLTNPSGAFTSSIR